MLLLAALTGLGAAAWYLFWPRVTLPSNALAVVPADAYAALRVRVDRVYGSEAYQRLVVARGQARGIERVEVMCGFNPLARLTELTVFARPAPDGGMPRIAFAARGELHHDELLDCVKKIAGGSAPELVREDIEGIPTLRSKKGSSRAAFVGRDGILGGDAESVRAAIHTLLGKAPSVAQDRVLSGLYREVEQTSDVALVGRLPDEAKPLIRQLAALSGPEALLLAETSALSATLNMGGGRLVLGTSLIMPDPRKAAALVEAGQRTIARLLEIPGIGLTPAAGVLRGVQMETRGERATFAGGLKVSTLESLLDLLPALDRVQRDVLQGAATPRAADADAAAPSDLPDASASHPRSRRRAR